MSYVFPFASPQERTRRLSCPSESGAPSGETSGKPMRPSSISSNVAPAMPPRRSSFSFAALVRAFQALPKSSDGSWCELQPEWAVGAWILEPMTEHEWANGAWVLEPMTNFNRRCGIHALQVRPRKPSARLARIRNQSSWYASSFSMSAPHWMFMSHE